MNPDQLAKALRKIATRIDNSKRPDKGLVAASIYGAIRNISSDDLSDWLEPLSDNSRGSDIMWHAFKNLGHNNWNENINDDEIITEIKKIVAESSIPSLKALLNNAIKYTQENYATYLNLKESGEI